MQHERVFASLIASVPGTSIKEAEIVRMVDDEFERLSAGAHIFDYIELLVTKRVRDTMRHNAHRSDSRLPGSRQGDVGRKK